MITDNRQSTADHSTFDTTLSNLEHITALLNQAQQLAEQHQLHYSGDLDPKIAWQLIQAQYGLLIDVRTHEERKFVGYIEQSIHVAWANGTSLTRNPRFIRELEKVANKEQVLILICRSGQRSALAASAAIDAGFKQVYNIIDGFEGKLNTALQRNQENGWKYLNLPWIQD
ncbi:rhodanese-like domain-containing protein [Acinetobacter rudis]|uniref:Rhodanese-like domain-containing protein n=1 Tax=Acinetobacter rudis TaxID=632955 RepID=A0AAW8J9P8_9GAMM|nr:rhodanese-like domain-containing protein [Acinetobacter rudis]MDQ8935879.1 rhodanese-like domain-containing protein [Acinetobacter rudis]MDQ8954542.1 rhodanese-like domain-containing protein [Acinetobacter rudis]MDQ9018083.1 rhodanese-like domain-containing protein [Acinetobacter rudis]